MEEILAASHREDGNAWEAVGRVLPAIEQAVDVLVVERAHPAAAAGAHV